MGFGVIEVEGHAYRCLDCGILRAIHLQRLDEKLLHIFEGLSELLRKHRPDAVAIEEVFFGKQKNPRGILLLGQARGVAVLAAAQGGAPLYEYSASRIKRAVGAGGGGSKGGVERMVRMLLDLPEQSMRADAYDGLAIALCHAHVVLGMGSSLSKASAAKAAASSFAERLKKSYVAPKEAK